jgi:hypothetical protein
MSARRGKVTNEALLELVIGPGLASCMNLRNGGRPFFTDDDARREAWKRHREPLMAKARAEARKWPLTYRRPWAWWRFDAERPDLLEVEHDYSADSRQHVEMVRVLAESGELLTEERVALLAEGRAARKRLGTPAEQYVDGTAGQGPDATAAAMADVLEGIDR